MTSVHFGNANGVSWFPCHIAFTGMCFQTRQATGSSNMSATHSAFPSTTALLPWKKASLCLGTWDTAPDQNSQTRLEGPGRGSAELDRRWLADIQLIDGSGRLLLLFFVQFGVTITPVPS